MNSIQLGIALPVMIIIDLRCRKRHGSEEAVDIDWVIVDDEDD